MVFVLSVYGMPCVPRKWFQDVPRRGGQTRVAPFVLRQISNNGLGLQQERLSNEGLSENARLWGYKFAGSFSGHRSWYVRKREVTTKHDLQAASAFARWLEDPNILRA